MSPRMAEDGEGKTVTAKQVTAGERFYCTHCGAEMTLAGGKNTRVRKHFRHPPGESCRAYGSASIEDVDDVHDQARFEIAEELRTSDWASRVREEWQVGDTVADVLFDCESGRVAVEVQVSGMSAEELISRTRRHTAEDVATLWVFHKETYRNENVSAKNNHYLTFRSAIMGYASVAGGTDKQEVYIPFYERNAHGELSIEVERVGLFEDGNGGFPERKSGMPPVETYRSESGELVATSSPAVLDGCDDPQQGRLFV